MIVGTTDDAPLVPHPCPVAGIEVGDEIHLGGDWVPVVAVTPVDGDRTRISFVRTTRTAYGARHRERWSRTMPNRSLVSVR